VIAAVALLSATGCGGRYVSDTDRFQARTLFEAATQQIAERNYAQALTMLQQANTLDPRVPLYRNAFGVMLLHHGRPDLAQAEFKRASEVDPAYAEAHLNLGIAFAEQREWAAAVASYERALKLPRLTSTDIAYQNLGLALYHLQRYPEAERALRFAISLEPSLAAAHYHLGLVLVAGNRRDEARRAFERTRELSPNSPFGQAAMDRLKSLKDGG
jgi:tetratricopeptide (TPR) repeat protein